MTLFPSIECRHHFMLEVGQGHLLYVEESGNPDGLPVVVLHGGPGGGSSPFMRRFFDPDRFRIIVFDQRGAGQSRPLAGCFDNTTAHLIADMELLREVMGVERWLVFGGSWGATLALAYLAEHAQRVLGMVLRGTFLCRPQDLDWLYSIRGAARLFPEAWQRLCEQAPAGMGKILERYHEGLQGEDARRYARHWCNWEATLALQMPQPDGDGEDDELCMARLETHYFLHQGFLNRPLLQACAGIDVPVEIVHGMQDFVCPAEQAWALHQVLPGSVLSWVEQGGHSSADPAISEALVRAVQRVEKRIAN